MGKKKDTKGITKELRKARIDMVVRTESKKGKFINAYLSDLEENDIRRKLFEKLADEPTVSSVRVFQGLDDENIESIKSLEKNHFDTVITDPDNTIFIASKPEEIDRESILNTLLYWSIFDPPVCFDRLLLGISLDRPKEDILNEIEKILDIHLKKKKTRFSWLMKWLQYKQVWDARRTRKNFNVIAKELNLRKDTVRKMFYRAYEIIFGKKYDTNYYEKPEIKKKYLKRVCETCKERKDCTDLCPDVLDFVNQDTKSQRELIGYNTVK